MSTAEYYIEHEQRLQGALDGMIEAADMAADPPAAVFARLVAVLDRDPDRAVTLAAVAIMRLAGGAM